MQKNSTTQTDKRPENVFVGMFLWETEVVRILRGLIQLSDSLTEVI
jgi:hypothetical protein